MFACAFNHSCFDDVLLPCFSLCTGGLPDVEQRTLGMYPSGLFGCLANLTLSSHLSVDLMVDAEVASNIGQCD